MGGTGLGHRANSLKKRNSRKGSAAKCAAIPSDLAKVVAAWPELPTAIRRAIVALVDAAG
jgi:hypothetical protein